LKLKMPMLQRVRDALLVVMRKRPAERYVLMHYAIFEMIERAAANCANEPETGGILLGCVRGPHLEITGFTFPGPTDVRTLSRFVRQDESHEEAAKKAWVASDRTVSFIGEWHTHPVGKPIPSNIDGDNWSELALKSRYPMLFLLAAPGNWRAFLVTRSRTDVIHTELVVCERGDLGVVLA
jgi:integrative and conjugative element protein (TIGR02256 family)